jgi:uncharacterized protein YlxW (UPF0749 family)
MTALVAERHDAAASQHAHLQAQGREQALYAEVQSLRTQVEQLTELRTDLEEKLDAARAEAAKVCSPLSGVC